MPNAHGPRITGAQAAVLAALITGLFGCIPYFFPLFGYVRNKIKVSNPSDDYKSLVEKAVKAKKHYILDSVTVHLQVEDNSPHQREVLTRIFYNVHALDAIQQADDVFEEKYESHDGKEIERWYGPDNEVDDRTGDVVSPHEDYYGVHFDIPIGQTQTVITGANFYYSLPLAAGRKVMTDKLGPNEDIWDYPNVGPSDNDVDYIYKLNILIESRTVNLLPVPNGALRWDGISDHLPQESNIVLGNYQDAENTKKSQKCLFASWNNVVPGETVAIHYSWQ